MVGEKSWFQSRTIWAALILILAELLRIWGLELDEEMQSKMVQWILDAISLFGPLAVIWCRTRAKKEIKT